MTQLPNSTGGRSPCQGAHERLNRALLRMEYRMGHRLCRFVGYPLVVTGPFDYACLACTQCHSGCFRWG